MRWGWLAVGVALGAVGARADALPCRRDDSLTETAASLLLRGGAVRGATLLADARVHGFDGVAVHAREGDDDASLAKWIEDLGVGEGEVVCGEARSEQRRLVLAARRGGRITRAGGRLRVVLEPGFRAPSLIFEGADGELQRVPLGADALADGVVSPSGARRVQLVAESGSGPRPIAELVLAEDSVSSALTAPRAARSVDGPRTRAPDIMLGQLTSFRREQGLGELRENQLLTASAQRHAARICELGRLAHRVEGEDPELRLRREHVSARHVGEVIARAESSDRAFQALLDSPSHRLALSRREFTDAGVGQASDRKGQVCLVMLLAAWPRRLP